MHACGVTRKVTKTKANGFEGGVVQCFFGFHGKLDFESFLLSWSFVGSILASRARIE